MKIDYGVQIEPQFGYKYSHISDVAQAAEKHGFESAGRDIPIGRLVAVAETEAVQTV